MNERDAPVNLELGACSTVVLTIHHVQSSTLVLPPGFH